MIVQIELAGKIRVVQLEKDGRDGAYQVSLDGTELAIEARLQRPGVLSLLIGDRAYRCVLDEDADAPAIYIGGQRYLYRVEDPRSLNARRSKTKSSAGPISVNAPMPGRVVRLMAKEGDAVVFQQGIVVIEAMKMQNELKAPKAGHVTRILVEAGATVVSGQPLAIIE